MSIATLLGFPVGQAKASERAWDEFRQAVESKCRASLPEGFKIERMRIDPCGSESYGIAVVDGTDTADNEKQTLVCIYDKKRQAICLVVCRRNEPAGGPRFVTELHALSDHQETNTDAAAWVFRGVLQKLFWGIYGR